MFWGLNLKPNRKYSQTTSKNFHISQAALSEGDSSQVFVTSENQKYLICTLEGACKQVSLDLNFAEGEEVSFQTVGSGSVTLSGYVIVEDYEEEDEDSDYAAELYNQLKKTGKKAGAIKSGDEDAEDDDDDDDEDVELDGLEDDDSEVGDEEDEDSNEEQEDDDEDEEAEDSDEEDEIQQPKAKQAKLEKPHSKQNGVAKNQAVADSADKKSKKDKKNAKKEQQKPQEKPAQKQQQPQQQQQQQQKQQKNGGERTLQGGVKVEELKVGNGPEVKIGKRAIVYYEGRLKSNNKVFDSNKQGAGFKFNVGRGEVIRGWDVGVMGMKVGGKRRIVCPADMAYGKKGIPPTIPPNSTLVFEVELKGVH